MLTVNSTINLAGQAVPNIIPAVQGDTGRVIVFTLADFTIPSGSTATYYVQKPSGEAVYNSATIDGNKVTVELTAQSLAETGDNYGQVRILNGEDVVTSFDFILLVKPFRGIDAVESTTEMNIFDTAVQNAMANIDGMLPNIIAPVFDASTAYSAGEYVIYSGKLYQFTTDHAAGAWTGADAEETTVAADSIKGVPNTVRQAIFTLLSKAIYTETGLTDEKAIVEEWASVEAIGIVLSEQTISFDGEGTHQLRAILTPPDSTDEPLWSTSDANVAVVSQSGLVSTVGNGSCTISASIGSLVATCAVTVTGIATYYSISNALTKVENSNDSEVSLEGSAYLATLTASTGYALDAVTVAMGGTDVTSTVYSSGEINIPAVTGDVEITASAVLKGTNMMKPVTSTNWNISTHMTISNVDGNDFTCEVIDSMGLSWNAILLPKNLTEKSSVLSGKSLFIEYDVEGLSGSTSDTDKIIVGISAFDRANPTSGGQRKGSGSKEANVDGHYSLEVAVADTNIQLSDSYYLGGYIYFYGPQGYTATIKNVVLTYY